MLAEHVGDWLDSFLDLLAPACCLACGLPARTVLCARCHGGCLLPAGPACLRCGAPWSRRRGRRGGAAAACGRCRRWGESFAFDQAVALFRYRGPARQLVRALKFRGDRHAATAAGRWMAADPRCAAQARAWSDALVVNVPCRAASRRQRGYDQAECLAEAFAAAVGRQHAPAALRRRRQSGPQVGRSRAARRAAVADAFVARRLLVLDRPVVLIDDVLSTGASADAAARALYRAGARAVAVVTFAT